MVREELFPELINHNNYKTVVEVGVQRGNFSQCLLSTNLECLILIDGWDMLDTYADIASVSKEQQSINYRYVLDRFENNKKVTVIKGYSTSYNGSDNTIDLVYLDANHSFDYINNDINFWFPKIKKNGIISGHDYLDGNLKEGNFGVKSAVDKFAQEHNLIVNTTDEPLWKSWWIQL